MRTGPPATNAQVIDALTAIPNVGPATAEDLIRLGIREPSALVGEDPDALHERLCELDGHRHDPCVRDVFEAAIAYATDGTQQPWWVYSRKRKEREAAP